MVERVESSNMWNRILPKVGYPTIVLAVVWVPIVIILSNMLANSVSRSRQFGVERNIMQTVYVVVLCWYLLKTGPAFSSLPDISFSWVGDSRVWKILSAALLTLFFALELMDAGLVMVFIMGTVLWVIIPKFREVDRISIVTGVSLGAFAYVMGLPHLINNFVSREVFFVLAFLVPLMYLAGGILYRRTGLGGSKLLEGNYVEALYSFLWGCLLFVPLGLFNAAAGAPGMGITWMDKFWIPPTLPFFSGITEEIWFRFFLINLVYFLFRPAVKKYPVIAVLFAVLFSALTFGLGHAGSWLHRVLVIGMLFGFPLGAAYVKRDYEHAVGGHYMINMIPTLMVFLGVT
ncbi:MAG: CPBP family glutamic-type intramembrane protease [Candidatus Kariarchaeaceae archaeon]|jgi:hypothetical protein